MLKNSGTLFTTTRFRWFWHLTTIIGDFFGSMSSSKGSRAGYSSAILCRILRCTEALTWFCPDISSEENLGIKKSKVLLLWRYKILYRIRWANDHWSHESSAHNVYNQKVFNSFKENHGTRLLKKNSLYNIDITHIDDT